MFQKKIGIAGVTVIGLSWMSSTWQSNASAHDLSFQLNTQISGQKVYLASELTDWASGPLALKEVSPGSYFLTIPQPWLHRINYRFDVDGRTMPDPLNPNRLADGHGETNSFIDLPFKEDPLLEPVAGIPHWRSEVIQLKDCTGKYRAVHLSFPPAYAYNKRAVVVYFQDGTDYLAHTGVENLLANLSARSDMPVLYGVFIPPLDRDAEYGLTSESEPYIKFMVKKVIPKIEHRFHLRLSAKDRLLIGPSLGGAITLYTAFRHPEMFQYAASQSAAQDLDDPTLFNLIEQSPYGKPAKLFMETGIFEPADWVAYARRAHASAVSAGILVEYKEYPSTHDWIGWRNRMGDIFKYFFKQ